MYKCICGKEFDKNGRLIYHHRSCEVYKSYKEECKKQYYEKIYTCINCGASYRIPDQEWATEKFCSKYCRQSHSASFRTADTFRRATEKRLSNVEAMERNAEHLRNLWKTRHDDIVEACNKSKRTPEFRAYASKKSKEFWDSLSKEEKKARVTRSFLKKDAGKCYEDIWEDIFIANNIPYKREVKFYKYQYMEVDKSKKGYNIDGYTVDFLVDNRIDFEVDGVAHNQEHDRIRDDFFINKVGLKVYRVNATLDEQKLREETEKFLKYYKENT